MIDVATVKEHAKGRWRDLIPNICALDSALLDSRHHPCPKCGGKDRFRAFPDFDATGGVICNQCHAKQNSDGISTVQWMLDYSPREALSLLANELGIKRRRTARRYRSYAAFATQKEYLRSTRSKPMVPSKVCEARRLA